MNKRWSDLLGPLELIVIAIAIDSPMYSMRPLTKQILSFVRWQSLREAICYVIMRANMGHGYHSSSHRSSTMMVSHWRMFLLRVDSTFAAFLTTLSLSHSTYVGSPCGMGTPNLLSFKRRCSMASRHVFNAMNSAEKVLVSTVCWCLLYHTMGARFRKST